MCKPDHKVGPVLQYILKIYCIYLSVCFQIQYQGVWEDISWVFGFWSEIQSTLDISKLMGLFFTSSNFPKCKLICTSGNLDLLKKPPFPNYGWSNQSKCIFYSDRRFEVCRIRDLRVRDIEIRLYVYLVSICAFLCLHCVVCTVSCCLQLWTKHFLRFCIWYKYTAWKVSQSQRA